MSKKFLETIKIEDGKIFHLSYHQRRVEEVFHSFGKSGMLHLEEFIENIPPEGLYRCRVVYDLALRVWVEFIPYVKREVKTLKPIFDDSISYDKKYLNREVIDALFGEKGNCDDILIVKNGFICDTSIANIALYDNNHWVTPKEPLLKGTTRRRYIEEGLLEEKEIKFGDIGNFSKIALMNAMIDFDIIPKDNLEDILC